jgi:hypothetical protein
MIRLFPRQGGAQAVSRSKSSVLFWTIQSLVAVLYGDKRRRFLTDSGCKVLSAQRNPSPNFAQVQGSLVLEIEVVTSMFALYTLKVLRPRTLPQLQTWRNIPSHA